MTPENMVANSGVEKRLLTAPIHGGTSRSRANTWMTRAMP